MTKVLNKHMLPVDGDPMILHSIRKMAGAGVQDVLVVTSPVGIGQLGALLGSGQDYRCRVSFRVQDRPGGIADALLLAEDFCQDEDQGCVVVLGDNLWYAPLPAAMMSVGSGRAWVALTPVSDPERFGIAELDLSTRRIVRIEEKPLHPVGNLAVTGIYSYPEDVFGVIRQMTASGRGELEITDVNNHYATRSRLEYVTLPEWWIDAGTPESLHEANLLCREKPPIW